MLIDREAIAVVEESEPPPISLLGFIGKGLRLYDLLISTMKAQLPVVIDELGVSRIVNIVPFFTLV